MIFRLLVENKLIEQMIREGGGNEGKEISSPIFERKSSVYKDNLSLKKGQ